MTVADNEASQQTLAIRGCRPGQNRSTGMARPSAPYRRQRVLDTSDARRSAMAAGAGTHVGCRCDLTDLRVGTWVYASPLRTPWSMAWEAHSLSVLTEGRFEMGIGTGRPGIEDELASWASRY